MDFGQSARAGTSPLALVIENGHIELTVAILEAGADASDQRSGFAPPHIVTCVRNPKRGGDDPGGDPSPLECGSLNSLQFLYAS